jgi:hypothetical protein
MAMGMRSSIALPCPALNWKALLMVPRGRRNAILPRMSTKPHTRILDAIT